MPPSVLAWSVPTFTTTRGPFGTIFAVAGGTSTAPAARVTVRVRLPQQPEQRHPEQRQLAGLQPQPQAQRRLRG